MKTLSNLDVTGQRVLIRADLKVPVKNGAVTSDLRIVASLPTIKPVSYTHLTLPTNREV